MIRCYQLYNIVINSTILYFTIFAYNMTIGKVVKTMLDYSPMWDTMERKGVSQYSLLKAGIDNKTLDSLKKGKNITLLTLEKICQILDCSPNEVVQFKKD